jgi:hypothetical protein
MAKMALGVKIINKWTKISLLIFRKKTNKREQQVVRSLKALEKCLKLIPGKPGF